MADCTCNCWKVFLVGPTPGMTYTIKYPDCQTGLDVYLTIDPALTPLVNVCLQGTGTPTFVSSTAYFSEYHADTTSWGFKVVDCLNPDNFFYTATDLTTYLNTTQALEFNEFPGCWRVVEGLVCTSNILVTISNTYTSCEACNSSVITSIMLTSCCGFSAYFTLDSSIPYLSEGNVYVYTGAPLADGFGNTLYPNICYSYSSFATLPATVAAPALASFTTSQGLTCQGTLCQNCFYKLTNCDNLAQILYTYTDLHLYLGQTITITGYTGVCWTVEASTTAIAPIAVTRVSNYADCPTCKGYFFTINDCCTNEPYLINNLPVLLEYHGDADPGFAPEDLKDLVITTINSPGGGSITGCFVIAEYTPTSNPIVFPVTQTIIDWNKDIEFVTVPTCNDCKNCNTCYLLTNCVTGEVEYITGTDLLQYIGGVITIKGCKDQCWIVTQAENCDGCGGAVQVVSYFPSTDAETPQMCQYSIEFKNYASITSATIIIDGTLYTLAATSLVTLVSSINALGLGTCYYGGGGLTGTVLLGITGDHVYGSLCVFGT